jgi:hypothetical protein
MTVTAPNIDVTFKQLASTAVARSQNGYAILIIKDDTITTNYAEYSEITDVTASDYTTENYQYIEDVFVSAPYMVCVVRIPTTGTISDALTIVKQNVNEGFITIADGGSADFITLQSWIATQNASGMYYDAIVYQATTLPNSKYVVNFANDSVYFSDTTRGKQSGLTYLPSLIGIYAKCGIDQATDYYKCTNLSKVTEVASISTALGNGQLVLTNDGSFVRILRGINSLTTTDGSTTTEDMKEILVVQVMQQMKRDIVSVFKNDYLGQYKNKYDNQVLFISAVNSYFKTLEGEDVLDSEYDNVASIDVEAQRQALISAGKTEAISWTDAQVKQETYKRSLFLKANVKILQSFVDLDFTINLD